MAEREKAEGSEVVPSADPIARLFCSIHDLPFELPIKAVGDALHILQQNFPVTVRQSIVQRAAGDADAPAAVAAAGAESQGKDYVLVPTRLQVYKEQSHQSFGKKFGFVEFRIFGESKAPPELVEALMLGADEIFASPQTRGLVQATVGAPFYFRRIPNAVVDHLEACDLVTKARDSLKILALVASRLVDTSSIQGGAWSLPVAAWPLHDTGVLRVELPALVPPAATAETVDKFFVSLTSEKAGVFRLHRAPQAQEEAAVAKAAVAESN
jgi:hypothetical protein